MFGGIIDMPAKGWSKVSVVASSVGDEVIAPIIEHAPVRIGEAIRDIRFETSGVRFESEYRSIVIAQGTNGSFDLRAMKHAIAQINGAARLNADGVGGVMRIRRIEAHQNTFLPVALPIPIRIANEPEARRLHNQHAVFVKLKASRRVKVIQKDGALVRFA